MVKLKVVGCLLKRELLLKKFKAEIKYRTRRQQPKNLEMVIASINPAIRGWGNYFKEGTVKKRFGELDGYVRARLRSFRAKKRNWRIILYTFPKPELEKMGLVSLGSLLDHPSPATG